MKLFVWDLHGVLEQGNDNAALEVTNYILGKFGFTNELRFEDAKLLSGKKWFEYFEYLLPNENTKMHFDLQKACFEYSNDNFDITKKHITKNEYALDVLEQIHSSKHTQILISNTQQKSLEQYLDTLNIKRFFRKKAFYGVDAHTTPHITKKYYLNTYLQNKKFDELISIGDSPHDMALASLHPKGKSYLYSYPERPHRKAESTYKITDLRDVLKELN